MIHYLSLNVLANPPGQGIYKKRMVVTGRVKSVVIRRYFMIKEYSLIIGSYLSSIYVKIDDNKQTVLFSMRDKEYNTVNYLFNYEEFRLLCDNFKILKEHLPEK
jgi:hypothetical protein